MFYADNQFRMSILERLEQMERRMAEMAGQQQQSSGGPSESGGSGTGGGEGGRSNSEQAQVSFCATLSCSKLRHIPISFLELTWFLILCFSSHQVRVRARFKVQLATPLRAVWW